MSAEVIDLAQARERLRSRQNTCETPHMPKMWLSVHTSSDLVHHLFQHMEPDDFLEFMMATRDEQAFQESDAVVKELVGHYYLMRTAEGTNS